MKTKNDFIELLEKFVMGKMRAEEFEKAYLHAFLKDTEINSGPIYDVLNTIFWDVEDFVSDENLRDYGDLDEKSLLSRCAQHLENLRNVSLS